ncbi:purine nucleoside phosphorylase YfiH [Rahnella woolbedingensis]|uniref:Purine nucleoside phosphorylase n=1 Tax=Rahnella woolbedingensis TaxID=1510574 RepID=A0A419N540_9GAMM|nr:purine nucleoside phosphorylase YfiH [Rahnella woolbedingensis]RJT40528.1 peptidoglycan editing factor PgeF [Rahnella woolbedingensis]
MSALIQPQWPQPASVRSCATTREGGVSLPPYGALNLGSHVGDSPEHVALNRQRLIELGDLPAAPHWLEQVHGTDVAHLSSQTPAIPPLIADAAYTRESSVVCAAMTADCLPVLFCSKSGDEVAAAHAGWRGLCAGVLEKTVACFDAAPADIMAWMGPAIGPAHFEVGGEVREAFMAVNRDASVAFIPVGTKFMADIYQLARLRLQAAGITAFYGGEYCTVTDSNKFYSYRRDGVTGRLASLIWLI